MEGPENGGKEPLLSEEEMRALAEKAGMDPNVEVEVVDDGTNPLPGAENFRMNDDKAKEQFDAPRKGPGSVGTSGDQKEQKSA